MDLQNFPQEFVERMQRMLCGEDEAFFASYEQEPRKALRLNPLKNLPPAAISFREHCRESVPWESMGYCYDETLAAGRHPYHEAGVYYIQEPSAMSPVSYMDVREEERVLDLCAAPGGKSTQIAGRMYDTGLLISNEIHPQRAKILSENIERMGFSHTIVTNETPERLSERFPDYFDKILVDAPCSGEGMFRKNAEAPKEWSPENVAMCAARQDEILDYADKMLRYGGRMVYSTCTFAPEEDEGTIARFLRSHPEYHVLEVPLYEGMIAGEIPGTIRLYPHRIAGEGHFVAVLIKGDREIPSEPHSITSNGAAVLRRGGDFGLSEQELAPFRKFAAQHLIGDLIKSIPLFYRFADHLYALPDGAPPLNRLKVVRGGLELGTFKKDRFEPAHALAHFLKMTDVVNYVDLPAESSEISAFLNGQTLTFADLPAAPFDVFTTGNGAKISIKDADAPWVLVCVDTFPVGWSKFAASVFKNHYPKGLRKPV